MNRVDPCAGVEAYARVWLRSNPIGNASTCALPKVSMPSARPAPCDKSIRTRLLGDRVIGDRHDYTLVGRYIGDPDAGAQRKMNACARHCPLIKSPAVRHDLSLTVLAIPHRNTMLHLALRMMAGWTHPSVSVMNARQCKQSTENQEDCEICAMHWHPRPFTDAVAPIRAAPICLWRIGCAGAELRLLVVLSCWSERPCYKQILKGAIIASVSRGGTRRAQDWCGGCARKRSISGGC
jgi:hypothetical protein